ncbi:hypothetical protein, partial [Microseira wollei]|uniref:hypothetical protein n=1 Tax=Microseira wollei TaxID=467598 RepID=UPI001CFD5608
HPSRVGGAIDCHNLEKRDFGQRCGRLKSRLHKQNLPTQVSKPWIFFSPCLADFVCIAPPLQDD